MEPLNSDRTCPRCDGGQPVSQHASPQSHCLPPGTTLANGRYLVGRVLGQGGFGITYIGRDLTLDMRIAIKEYYPAPYVTRSCELTHEVTAQGTKAHERLNAGRIRFLEEARVLARFHNNPGIVGVRDFFEENGTAYIVMDYLDGETLKSFLQHGSLDPNQAFDLMRPMLDALELVHANHVIHRDISPDNIMLCSDGSLCLMDFGAAFEMDFSDQRSVSMVLKSGYAPEEQYRAKGELGPWTDIYALCATIYRAITGVAPDESLQRMISDEMAWPRDMGVNMSPEQEAILKKGMAPLKADRYQSVAEMKQDLDRIALTPETVAETIPEATAASEAMAETQPVELDETAAPTEVAQATELAEPVEPVAPSEAPKDVRVAEPDEPADPIEPSDSTEPTKPAEPVRRKRAIWAGAVAAVALIIIAALAFFMMPHTVSFQTNGGTEVASIEANRLAKIDEPEAPSREGHAFAGWYLDDALSRKAEFPLSASSDITLYAAWEKTRASYSVSYLDATDDSPAKETKTVADAPVGSTVEEQAPEIEGYVAQPPEDAKLTISEDDSQNIVKFYYRKLVPYTVRYCDEATGSEIAIAKTIDNAVEGTEVTETAIPVAGYTPKAPDTQTLTPTRDADANVITFNYERVQQAPTYTYEPDNAGDAGGNDGGDASDAGDTPDTSEDVTWAN